MKYRYCMNSATDAGETRHPQIVIRELAPDATELEPVPIADCWLFVANEIKNCPGFVVRLEGTEA